MGCPHSSLQRLKHTAWSLRIGYSYSCIVGIESTFEMSTPPFTLIVVSLLVMPSVKLTTVVYGMAVVSPSSSSSPGQYGSGFAAGSTCPRVCFCNSPSRIVYCSRRGLHAIPDGVASDTLQLNMNGNAFRSSTIARSNLSSFGQLEHLYLSECQLEHIEVLRAESNLLPSFK